VTGQLDFPLGVPDEEYTPTPPDLGAALARQLLDRWWGDELEEFPHAPPGACDDCGQERRRVWYGWVFVCRQCARRRIAAGEKAAA